MIKQTKNPMTGRYVKIDTEKGQIVAVKKSPGAYKNTPILKKK